MKKILAVIAILLLSTSCVSVKRFAFTPNDKLYRQEIPQSFDIVWSKAIDFVSINSLDFRLLDKENGLITIAPSYMSATYQIEGKPLTDDKYMEVQYRSDLFKDDSTVRGVAGFNIRIKKTGQHYTEVTITMVRPLAEVLPMNQGGGISNVWRESNLNAKTTGKFERELLDYLSSTML